ncbi:hypothetical protein D043_0440B, partial [Vibrio parahaemolyticus EKP-021]
HQSTCFLLADIAQMGRSWS